MPFTATSTIRRLWGQRVSGLFCRNRRALAEPGFEVCLGARGVTALAGHGFFAVVEAFSLNTLWRIDGREEAEVHVHGLEGARALVSCFDVAASDVVDQCAVGRCGGWRGEGIDKNTRVLVFFVSAYKRPSFFCSEA